MSITPRRNRLFDMQYDEVSAVDRPANQLGLIAIAKALGEADVADTEQLRFEIPADVQPGDTVVRENGDEFVFAEVDEDGHLLPIEGMDIESMVANADEVYDLDLTDEDEPDYDEDVGKAEFLAGAKKLGSTLYHGVGKPGNKTFVPGVKHLGQEAGAGAKNYLKQNPYKAAAIAGGAGVAGGGAYMVAKKSLGTSVLEELSKAVSDEERNLIVAKMADDQQALAEENERLAKAFEDERDARLTEAFIAKAAEYELPVDPEVFGPILKAMVEVLDDEELEVLDQVLASRGVPLDEIGYAGGASNSGVLDEVSGLAAELVGKAAGQVTTEQATAALFDHNPNAYEAYLAEQEGR